MIDFGRLARFGTHSQKHLALLRTLAFALPAAMTCSDLVFQATGENGVSYVGPDPNAPPSPYDIYHPSLTNSVPSSDQSSGPACDRTDGVACEG